MRWLLLDEVIEIQKGKCAKARSSVPGHPFSPECLMIEMMAQAGALLIGAMNDFQKDLIFAKIEKASFKNVPEPGTGIQIEAQCEHIHTDGGWVDATIRDGNEIIADARCLLMNVGSFTENPSAPITFHQNFMEHFQIRDKVK